MESIFFYCAPGLLVKTRRGLLPTGARGMLGYLRAVGCPFSSPLPTALYLGTPCFLLPGLDKKKQVEHEAGQNQVPSPLFFFFQIKPKATPRLLPIPGELLATLHLSASRGLAGYSKRERKQNKKKLKGSTSF